MIDCLRPSVRAMAGYTPGEQPRDGAFVKLNTSTGTIRAVLIDAGWSWQRSRSWCETGTVQRKRKSGVVTVVDPDAEAKRS